MWHARNTLAMVFSLLLCSPAGATEPNDRTVEATALGPVSLGEQLTLEGTIGDGAWSERDVDLFSFQLDAQTTFPVLVSVEVVTNPSGLDGFLRLFDLNGNELANNDDASFTTTDPRISSLLLAAGTYFVGVSAAENPHYDPTLNGSGRPGTGGSYTLTLRVETGPSPTGAFEPNDTVSAATYMGTGSFTVSGFIGDGANGRRDVDAFRVHLTQAARMEVRVRVEDIASPLVPAVRIRNCTNATFDYTQADECSIGLYNSTPNGSLDALATAGVLAAQDVYILVSGVENQRFDPTEPGSGENAGVGPYELDVTVTLYNVAAQSGRDDSASMARRLAAFVPGRPETVEVEGYLGDGSFAPFQGDRDFYDFALVDETRLLSIDVVPLAGSPLDPVVVVYDGSGRRIARNDNAGPDGAAGVVVPVECVPAVAGAKSGYVAVMGVGQRPPADAFLPAADATAVEPQRLGDGPGSTGAYRLTVGVSEIVQTCGGEPNDTLADAAATGLTDFGSFACTNGEFGDGPCVPQERDVDIWSFDVLRPPIYVDATLAACRADAVTHFTLALFDASGELVAHFTAPIGNAIPRNLSALLDTPGRYYLVAAGSLNTASFDPRVACQSGVSGLGSYDLILRLGRGRVGPALARGEPDDRSSSPALAFAGLADRETNRIQAIDAATGAVLRTLTAPEPFSGGSAGLAYDGTRLYYVGSGRYPDLYALDPVTGAVLDRTVLWVGSGFYSDAVMLGGELILLDYRDRSLHFIDPLAPRHVRTLYVGSDNAMLVAGGVAALSAPDRLYVADAFGTRSIFELDPRTGASTRAIPVPPEAPRPTALAGVGISTLLVADWQSSVVARMDADGNPMGAFSLDGTAGALAGHAEDTCARRNPPRAEMIGSAVSVKNRVLSFDIPDGGRMAVRVTFDVLPAPFDLWNGAELWVGPPATVSETAAEVAPGGGPTFAAARLQCMPHYMVWSDLGTVHAFHEGVVPGAAYLIDVIDAACDAGSAGSYSPALPIATAEHGDTVADLSVDPPLPPNGPPIDIVDALAILERFSNAPGAIIKARADLEPGCLDLLINVSDVLMSLRGFAGLGYAFAPTSADPCASPCVNPLP